MITGLTYISRNCNSDGVHAFDVLGDPVRCRILELLADGEQASGAICAVIQEEFGISQPAVSMHLRVLRESGFTAVRAAAICQGGEHDRYRDRLYREADRGLTQPIAASGPSELFLARVADPV